MPTHPTGYVSLCEVAKRAAVALHEPAGGALDVVSRALLIIGGGEGWAAVLKDLQADNDHVPHTLRAFAWCRGHSPLLEIRSAFWRGGFEGASMRIDHTSPAPQGAPVSILPRHVRLRGAWAVPPVLESEAADFARLDGEWALPLVLESDAADFARRITDEQGGGRHTIASAKRLRGWLADLMRASPDKSQGKAAVIEMAKTAGYVFADRRFARDWAAAVEETGAAAWSRAGRKKSKQ